ncbi:glycosyltransferase family 2 protein [Confluentibacter lentus]|uniref:glycosyltransferase family 2 protein n=1 Tax=Confluentibacter lentus TaxID=1699412 RepID=UPI000C28F944|nr:glycosyltransferase family 2 protein [Confluentibacter lentus]
MNNLLVSVIIPCYNQGLFLNNALQSVLDQTYTNWECIIVNDGSIDDSENIAKNWVAKDARFRYFYKPNSGVSATRNLALDKVKGHYIQFLDADDILDKRKLELSLNALDASQSENQQIVISNFRMFSGNANVTSEPYCILNKELFTYQNLLYKWNESFSIPIHCGFFETFLFRTIRFPENLTAQEDWMVWVKLFRLNIEVFFLDKPLAFYRQNLSGRTKTKSLLEDQIRAYEYLKEILDEKEFHRLSIVLITRYYRAQEEFKSRLRNIKMSQPYQTGLIVKKVLKAFGLLKISKKIFPFFLKFKTKN